MAQTHSETLQITIKRMPGSHGAHSPRLPDTGFPVLTLHLRFLVLREGMGEGYLPSLQSSRFSSIKWETFVKKLFENFMVVSVSIHPHFFPEACFARLPSDWNLLCKAVSGRHSKHENCVLNKNYFCQHIIFIQGIFIIWFCKQQLATSTEVCTSSVIREPSDAITSKLQTMQRLKVNHRLYVFSETFGFFYHPAQIPF